jgi:hypothetical protein
MKPRRCARRLGRSPSSAAIDAGGPQRRLAYFGTTDAAFGSGAGDAAASTFVPKAFG